MTQQIAIAKGDGIGPEIMDAVLEILHAAHLPLEFVPVEMGKSVFERGFSSGMTEEAKAKVESLGILLKGPMETPKGKGMKSINVTARKVWNTYANKRIFRSLAGVETVFSKAGIPIDITVVRENIEDTYGSIEHMLTGDVALCRRFITRPGSLQVHRYAFEMARRKGARRITCGHKANIMKLTDGLFLECFYEVAKEYPELKADDVIVDDLCMKLVVHPEQFDVIVLPNLQGDIVSDLCAGLVGGLGFAPSANIGDHISIFEAVHGTAPDITGQNKANPTALLLSSCMMLRHIGFVNEAASIENALYYTLEQGIHTADIPGGKAVGTREFANAIIANLGKHRENPAAQPDQAPAPVLQKPAALKQHKMMTAHHNTGEINGADFFIESTLQPGEVAEKFQRDTPPNLRLVTISNRGTQVWPTGSVFTECINQYRVRLEKTDDAVLRQDELLTLAFMVAGQFKLCSIEILMSYDGKKSYSLAQGQ